MSRLSSKKLRNLGSSLDGSLNIFPGQFQNILLFSSTLSVLRWFQRSSEYRSVLSLLFSQFSCFLLQFVFQLHVWCLMFGLVVRAEIRRQLNWQFTTCGQVRVRRGEWYLRRSCLHIKGLYYSFFLSPSAVPERRATKAQTGSSAAVQSR